MSHALEDTSNTALVPEAEDYDADADSTFGSIDGSSTASITSSILKYREVNGRTYHAFAEERDYVLPNDEPEKDRLDLQHHLYRLTLNDRLYTSEPKVLQRVLDVGTGTGIWAMEFADEHPEAQVIGVDLSPTQPHFVAPNVQFQIDDVEQPWTYSSKFDFIHVRMMTGAIADWPRFMQQCYDNLNPGGYVELSDIVFPIKADDDSLPESLAILKWSKLMLEASIFLGSPLDGAMSSPRHLEAVGFTEIVEHEFKWPINRWPKDRKFKELGMWTHVNVGEGLQGLSMALFTRGLKWSPEELEVFLVDVRNDMKNTRIHGYWPIRVVSARRPLE